MLDLIQLVYLATRKEDKTCHEGAPTHCLVTEGGPFEAPSTIGQATGFHKVYVGPYDYIGKFFQIFKKKKNKLTQFFY